MTSNVAESNLPLGLQKLSTAQRVSVSQQNTCFANKYVVRAADGELLFHVKEDSSALAAMFGGARRAFHMDMYDERQQLVVTLRRPYSLGASKLEVKVGGALASVVRQEHTFMKPLLRINDARDHPLLRVKGPASVAVECDFELQTLDKQRVGSIRKQWGGMAREMFTKSDQFEITFPQSLDVRYKAAVIGTCLLIDFLYYEKSG